MGAVLISNNFYGHPAVIQSTPRAIWLWVTGLCWSSRNGRTGRIPKPVAMELSGHYRPIQGLVKVGMWIDHGDEFEIAKRAGCSGIELWRYGALDTYRRAIPTELRQAVYERDGHVCLHCGVTDNLSLDHIKPYSLGGLDTLENLQTLCRPCNSRKGAKFVAADPHDQA